MIYCNLLYNCTPAAKLNTNTVAQWNTSMRCMSVSRCSYDQGSQGTVRSLCNQTQAEADRYRQTSSNTQRTLTGVSTVCILIFCMNVSTIHVCIPFWIKIWQCLTNEEWQSEIIQLKKQWRPQNPLADNVL